MTSFLDKAGGVSIRLNKEDREKFTAGYDTELAVQYGSVMKEFVVVPDDLHERPDELREWFLRSWQWVGTLEPKPTKR
jgi:hypothetical protein